MAEWDGKFDKNGSYRIFPTNSDGEIEVYLDINGRDDVSVWMSTSDARKFASDILGACEDKPE